MSTRWGGGDYKLEDLTHRSLKRWRMYNDCGFCKRPDQPKRSRLQMDKFLLYYQNMTDTVSRSLSFTLFYGVVDQMVDKGIDVTLYVTTNNIKLNLLAFFLSSSFNFILELSSESLLEWSSSLLCFDVVDEEAIAWSPPRSFDRSITPWNCICMITSKLTSKLFDSGGA